MENINPEILYGYKDISKGEALLCSLFVAISVLGLML